MNRKLITLLAALLSISSISSVASAQEKDYKSQIESKMVTIEIDRIFPQAGSVIDSNDGYTLTVSKDKVKSNLPYFGVSHTSIFPGVDEPGIRFDDCTVKIKSSRVKKDGSYVWKFTAKSGNEDVDVTVTIWDDGTAEIACIPENRTPITYRGSLVDPEE